MLRTWYHSFRVQLVSDLLIPRKKWSLNFYIFCSMLFYHISIEGASCNMKPMSVIFLFSDTCDWLSRMWNFNWNPFLLRKWAHIMKAYNIYVPYTFINWLWWYIDTFKMVDNNYLTIEFVRKDWEHPAKIFVNIYHRFWYG